MQCRAVFRNRTPLVMTRPFPAPVPSRPAAACTWPRCAFRSGCPRAGRGPAGRTRGRSTRSCPAAPPSGRRVTHPCSRNCSRRRCKRPIDARAPAQAADRSRAGVRPGRGPPPPRCRCALPAPVSRAAAADSSTCTSTSCSKKRRWLEPPLGRVPPERYRSEDEVPAFLNALCLFQVRCPSMHVPCPSLAGNSESSGTRHYDEANVA